MSDSIGTKEFAEIWGCKQATVAKWCREDKIEGANQDAKGSPWHIPKDAKPPKGYVDRRK
ncbi:helix-turn-helix domain-containing protein [Eubacterium sp. AB3007]|uniref:helix-turn-helix domain-containing protein n=1 Tax=Eubacterium sp. AB3007 TaxID=1392487 RepID=UPI00048731EB|nr:helix-turn-helix domain-containing protein [Eubacterium sp. AB3007]